MSMDLIKTAHAAIRMNQRGIGKADIELAICCGTPIKDGVFLSRSDVEVAIAERKYEIAQLQKLSGLVVVNVGNRVVTTYKATRPKVRRLLRSASAI